jgi:hypothetical protein
MLEVQLVAGRNPNNKPWRDYNKNVISIPHGSYTVINAAGSAEEWHRWQTEQDRSFFDTLIDGE